MLIDTLNARAPKGGVILFAGANLDQRVEPADEGLIAAA